MTIETAFCGSEELDKLSANRFIAALHKSFPIQMTEKTFHLMFWATIYGVVNFLASELLQIGMIGASAGKSAFIIGLNVVFIQMMEILLPDYDNSFSWMLCGAISLSVIGLYFISGCFDLIYNSSEESCSDVITHYDIVVFLSMVCFGICILIADAGSSRTDCIDLMCLSFFITTTLCIGMAIYFDSEDWLEFPSMSTIFSFDSFIVAYTGVAEVSAVTLGECSFFLLFPNLAVRNSQSTY